MRRIDLHTCTGVQILPYLPCAFAKLYVKSLLKRPHSISRGKFAKSGISRAQGTIIQDVVEWTLSGQLVSTNMSMHFFLSWRCAIGHASTWENCWEKCTLGKRINKPVSEVGERILSRSVTVKKHPPFHTLLTLPKRIICVFIHSFVLLTSSRSEINSGGQTGCVTVCA